MRLSDQRTADFTSERERLVRLSYRMLGSVSEAEDVVQDAWLRWAGTEDEIGAPAAYLTRIVTRLCLDRMKSARARRETYVGPWLPEPLVETADAYETIADDVTVTLMVALERLSPLERAAFLLHEVFDVALTEVAVVLDREPAAVRQLASRARKNVQTARQRYSVGAAEAERIARAFFAASRDGDVAALSALLARDVEIHSDGGGKVLAFRNVVRGVERALRLFVSAHRKALTPPTFLRTAIIDGLSGYVSLDPSGALQTTALGIRESKIFAIYIVKNPDKLTHIRV
ncbi:sigma-70 family RNA polymerase sigma factor [Mesorhizobium sp. J8]|uniref:sigma-70 family RNA polymerase sigma factor n=1 Tax=Mesorhizobium sp. J8 TaxID=2777475 RepID=UPI0019163488|nr:sigma-70 family RNA polymerase sigma factor [Mesorhizobium sp. J8]BCM19252.1 ECF RNA polymerase sigma factor SigJ [Mesorhizobium sp. J8]